MSPVSSKDIMQLVRRTYNAVAEKYASSYPSEQYWKYIDRMLAKLPPKSKILDVGCGPGTVAKHLIEHGHSVIGIDVSPKMIELANRNAPEGKFRVQAMQAMDFPAGKFNAALALFSLLHLPSSEFEAVISKVRHIVKKDGYFLVAVVRGKGESIDPIPLDRKRVVFSRGFSRYEINEPLMKAGFKILVIETNYSKNPFGIERQLWILCQAI